ncbi:unnamed protein product [Ambrosiozyma monospora]|uniref:Unnamed protein product n=1 Tax=Ambrosiozyma monospora TaxID=43982 RepID=A0ACB5UCH8_AMBMO|nr:unnamed protein product [Ambrosiozyma monospora]
MRPPIPNPHQPSYHPYPLNLANNPNPSNIPYAQNPNAPQAANSNASQVPYPNAQYASNTIAQYASNPTAQYAPDLNVMLQMLEMSQML